jgi:hypothetical protein
VGPFAVLVLMMLALDLGFGSRQRRALLIAGAIACARGFTRCATPSAWRSP